MRQARTRILSLLLALAMCLSLLPGTALAEETYTITFDAAGGQFDDGSETQAVPTHPEGVIVYFPDEPTREGYAFVSWGGMSNDDLKYHRFTSDETVRAVWESSPADISYTITFDANGGRFDDGSATMTVQTKWLGAGNNITATPPDPVREGYTFDGWDIEAVWNHDFDSDATVKAKWTKAPESVITFDPNGGTCTVQSLPLENGRISATALPVPTRAGYAFAGWFRSFSEQPITLDEVFTGPDTVKARWERTSKISPALSATSPDRINVGETKIEVALTCTTPGVMLDWRPLERILFGDGEPSDVEVAARSCISGDFGSVGLKLTDVRYEGDYDFSSHDDNAYPYDLYPEGVCPTPILVLTFEGEAKAGTLTIQLSGGSFVQPVAKGENTVLTESSAQMFNSAQVSIPIGSDKLNGPFTVKFDLNGATGPVPEPQTVAKGKTVELPVLKASNAKFLGWGYLTDDKTLVEWKAEDPVTGDLTLYAMWDLGTNEILKGLTYRFGNGRTDFGYSKSYGIPVERYEMVFGKTQGAALYDELEDHTWGGSCYGMAATSGMFFHGGGTTTSSFRSGAEVPYDLLVSDRNSSLKMTLTEYIEAVFISQYADRIQGDYRKAANLDSLYETAKAVRTSKAPVMIAIRGLARSETGKMVDAGHAVLGYAVVDVDDTESRLMVYDPNFPNTERYITLTKRGGSYTSWYYYLNDMYDWGTGQKNNSISVVPYADYAQVWNNRANRKNTPALFSTNAQNASILDSKGAVAATIKNGELTTNRSDIQPVVSYGVAVDGTAAVSDTSVMWLPAGQYTIETTDSASDGFRAVLADVDQSAAVSTTASAVTFAVSDDKALSYVRIDQAGAGYDITLYSTLEQGYEDVQLTGTTAAGGVTFAQISGSLYATDVDSGAALKIEGKAAETSALSGAMPDIRSLLSGSAQAPKPVAGDNPFTDVAADAYYYDAVLWAVANGITGGMTPTTFSPNDPCTRAQIVTFLWRTAGSPKPASSSNPFTDVAAGAYYYDAVLWAAEEGITGGTSATTFSPNDSCTRGQTVTFLWRYAKKPKAAAGANPFTDVAAGAYYYDAVLWAAEKKITGGTTPSTFGPTDTVTRAQTVTFLYRSQQN